MQKSQTLLSLMFCVLFTGWSHAAELDILPGLWENKVEVSSKSGLVEAMMEQTKQMLEGMPPEQQKMIKDMMAKEGVSFDFGTRTMQVCMTQEKIDNFALPQSEEDCTQSLHQDSPNRFKITMTCDDQNTSGEGEFVVKNSKEYSGEVVMGFEINGQSDTMTMKQRGQWLSADCGNLK